MDHIPSNNQKMKARTMAQHIPPHAKRVFQGIIFDVYQWQQEMFDGTTATFEALKRPNTIVVIPLSGSTVYYAAQEQPGSAPYLSLFGGRAEVDEAPLTTAKRELMEETGFESDDWQLFNSYDVPGKIDWQIYMFIARNCVKTGAQQLDGGEKITLRSASIDTFLSDIVPDPKFGEWELRREVLSAFNPDAVAEIKRALIGEAG